MFFFLRSIVVYFCYIFFSLQRGLLLLSLSLLTLFVVLFSFVCVRSCRLLRFCLVIDHSAFALGKARLECTLHLSLHLLSSFCLFVFSTLPFHPLREQTLSPLLRACVSLGSWAPDRLLLRHTPFVSMVHWVTNARIYLNANSSRPEAREFWRM